MTPMLPRSSIVHHQRGVHEYCQAKFAARAKFGTEEFQEALTSNMPLTLEEFLDDPTSIEAEQPGQIDDNNSVKGSIANQVDEGTDTCAIITPTLCQALLEDYQPANIETIEAESSPLLPLTDAALEQTTQVKQSGPVWLFFQDLLVLLSVLPWLPRVFLPFSTKSEGGELYGTLGNFCAKALLAFTTIVQLVILLPLSVLFFAMALIWIEFSRLLSRVLLYPTQGPRIVRSNVQIDREDRNHNLKHERWLFFNGIMSGESDVQNAVDGIARAFQRPVVGIHNETLGLVGDLIECLIQRCFSYHGTDVRMCYETLKAYLINPEVRMVVLIAHSQGGIIACMVLDKLLCELSHEMTSKLEIYTFGSAASHFSNPISYSAPAPSKTNFKPRKLVQHRVIKHIEHFVNEFDAVPRWGVLHSLQNQPANRHCGRVFLRKEKSGHLFCQHYLFPLFPMAASETLGASESSYLPEWVDFDIINVWNSDETCQCVGKPVREVSRLWRFVGGGRVLD